MEQTKIMVSDGVEERIGRIKKGLVDKVNEWCIDSSLELRKAANAYLRGSKSHEKAKNIQWVNCVKFDTIESFRREQINGNKKMIQIAKHIKMCSACMQNWESKKRKEITK